MKHFGLKLLFSTLLLSLPASLLAVLDVRVVIQNDIDTPQITVTNMGDESISKFRIIADPFDTQKFNDTGAWFNRNFTRPAGSTAGGTTQVTQSSTNKHILEFVFDSFDPGESFSAEVDIVAGAGNWPIWFFDETSPAVIEVTSRSDTANPKTYTLPTSNPGPANYTFRGPQRFNLNFEHLTKANVSLTNISGISVEIDGQAVPYTESGYNITSGDLVRVTVSEFLYRDMHGNNLDLNLAADGQERFKAIGITVNQVAETANPLRYTFEMEENTTLTMIWQHEYAITIDSDFSNTLGQVDGVDFVGPLSSKATGNPEPAVNKHWFEAGTVPVLTVDNFVEDITSHPGLKVRYKVKEYEVYGLFNPNIGTALNDLARKVGIDISTAAAFVDTIENISSDGAEPRIQIPARSGSTLGNPSGIKFIWQLQYGVDAQSSNGDGDDLVVVETKASISDPYVETVDRWFDPGTPIRVLFKKVDSGGDQIVSWFNGDTYYFNVDADIDPSSYDLEDSTDLPDPNRASYEIEASYVGLTIPSISRPVRAITNYGQAPIFIPSVEIGQPLFNPVVYPQFVTRFNFKPNEFADQESAVWDPAQGRLYPTKPGTFKLQWTEPDRTDPTQVIYTAVLPFDPERGISGHYPHIHGTPSVNVDPVADDNLIFKEVKYTTAGAAVDGSNLFTTTDPGISVLVFTELNDFGRSGETREFIFVRVVDSRNWDADLGTTQTATIGTKITETSDVDRASLGTGYLIDPNQLDTIFSDAGLGRYNVNIYDGQRLDGILATDIYDLTDYESLTLTLANPDALPGPIIPVNEYHGPGQDQDVLPVVVWYDNPLINQNILWPYVAKIYRPEWPSNASLPKIIIASEFGSEAQYPEGTDQIVRGASNGFPESNTFDPSRFQSVSIYSQNDPNVPGFNPNEEHAVMAPSLRNVTVSPRPPAAYALRDGDLNTKVNTIDYTSDPFVLVEFVDQASGEAGMQVYDILKTEGTRDFVPQFILSKANGATSIAKTPSQMASLGYLNVIMNAGEPVIPFYPLGFVIGASPPPEIEGEDLYTQTTYWEDWRGSYWAISGGENAWFSASFYYPLLPDFYWPNDAFSYVQRRDERGVPFRKWVYPSIGDSVPFLPSNPKVQSTSSNAPTKIVYKSEWPENPPVLKAGETLTFSGGEYRADNPTTILVENGEATTVETPGLPQVVAFASAEIVFDSTKSTAPNNSWEDDWTGRIVNALDVRTTPLSTLNLPDELQPAAGNVTIRQGKYYFDDLPASLQRRVRFNPIGGPTGTGQLEMIGLLNDKDIGDSTLTAAPPAVYVLEANILNQNDNLALQSIVSVTNATQKQTWDAAVARLYNATRNPQLIPVDETSGASAREEYLAGLMREPVYEGGEIKKDNFGNIVYPNSAVEVVPLRAFGPGLAVIPNGGYLDPNGSPDVSYITIVENNDASLGSLPITPHIIKVDRRERYRGAIKTVEAENVFDENVVVRSTGDFGGNAEDLYFEWWYRPDDGSTNVAPPDLIPAEQPNPWKLFPDPNGNRGLGLSEITIKGNPNAPEILLADSFWFLRYRHKDDQVSGTDWSTVNFTWAGAGNSDPFNDFDLNGVNDYAAQLVQGWIKRVLDAVNPYEARIREFEGDNPATITSIISQLGPRFEGRVALNPDKDVIENVGLIELYDTILDRARSLSIDLSRPVSSPAIANALQLASTRLADFYTLLGNEAYVDALDPSTGFGSSDIGSGSSGTGRFSFQNQMPSLLQEELSLLRGVDDNFARPVYNRLFWNFTKDQGEAIYATNYNITDVNQDGFIDEDDAMKLFPQGHGDAWGHYLTALRNTYELLQHPAFNWVSRSESYNLQDIVISVDFLDERKFAATAAQKAKAGAEIVDLAYRAEFVSDPSSQWQGYLDTNVDRAWGVDGWTRRVAQGAYFDWVTANALLPSEHPNDTLEGIAKVDRKSNSDISVISSNLNSVQRTLDNSDKGFNPLGVSQDALVMDIDPTYLEVGSGIQGQLHFEQIYERAVLMLGNAQTAKSGADEAGSRLRDIGVSETEFRNATFQEDLTYRNRLIEIFGKPYEGTIGPGRFYPAGYEGPDLALYAYVATNKISSQTVPGPAASYATFNSPYDFKELSGGDLYNAFEGDNSDYEGDPDGKLWSSAFADSLDDVGSDLRNLFNPTFASSTNSLTWGQGIDGGLFGVDYTDLTAPKVELDNLTELMPVTAAQYTFLAPNNWGTRPAVGKLQQLTNQMLQKEADVALAIAAWDALTGEQVRILRLLNARLSTSGELQERDEGFVRVKYVVNAVIAALETSEALSATTKETAFKLSAAAVAAIPTNLPTGGLAVSPGDAISAVGAGIRMTSTTVETALASAEKAFLVGKVIAEQGLEITEAELELAKGRDERTLNIAEWLKEFEDSLGDEPSKRIAVFQELQALEDLSNQYRSLLDEGARLIDERTAFNKRVAAATQLRRYQDMTFRISRNHKIQNYRSSFDLAAQYAFLAARAYDYETNFAEGDAGSARSYYNAIVKARSLGTIEDGQPQIGTGLANILASIFLNYQTQEGQLGLNNVQKETSDVSLRTELFRILQKGSQQPTDSTVLVPNPGVDSDELWRRTLTKATVDDLWDIPEFRTYCRPFAPEFNGSGERVPQPGIVIRFSTEINPGRNVFGQELSGGDHYFSFSNFATKIASAGVAFDDYVDSSLQADLAATPRVYLVPTGVDIMRVARSDDVDEKREWRVFDQRIPVPFPASTADLQNSGYIPVIDSLNGNFGEQRKFSDFRAYPSDYLEPAQDTRLIGRSVWNTSWVLIIPGLNLNSDSERGIERFIESVSDIKLSLYTYGQSGG